jgi:hypothetical protein
MSSKELLTNIVEYYNFPQNYQFDNFDLDLSITIIANSKVAAKKYALFNKSTFFSVIGIICALIVFALVGFV